MKERMVIDYVRDEVQDMIIAADIEDDTMPMDHPCEQIEHATRLHNLRWAFDNTADPDLKARLARDLNELVLDVCPTCSRVLGRTR
jgi:hypothetical protein